MNMNFDIINNTIPYELEIYQNLWVIEQQKKIEAIKKNKGK